MKQEYITIISKRVKKKIRTADILYIIKLEYLSLIHLIDGDILQTITPIYELKEMLGDDCIEVKKGCIVSVSAITNIKDKIYLCNGEEIDFTVRRRKAVRLEWREKQKLMIDEINGQDLPRTDEEYHKYYEICDKFPFAFTDIEMIFNEKRRAVDWIFRYGNEALAELEGVQLKEMIGSTFSGHCGCILHDMDKLQSMKYENWFGMAETEKRTGIFKNIVSSKEKYGYNREAGTYIPSLD